MEAGRRELAEGTGLTAQRLEDLATLDALPGITAARLHLIVATGLTPVTSMDDRRNTTEAGMTKEWLSIGEAVAAVHKGKITDARSVAGILLAIAASS